MSDKNTNKLGQRMTLYAKSLLSDASFAMTAVMVVIFIVILLIVIYVYTLSRMRSVKCNDLKDIYKKPPPIASLQDSDYGMKFLLRDFYIKSAYNSCSIANFKSYEYLVKRLLIFCKLMKYHFSYLRFHLNWLLQFVTIQLFNLFSLSLF